MKKKDGFVLRDVCGQKVIVGEGLGAVDFGRLVSLNETAAWLWEHAEGDIDVDRLAEDLCGEYDVEPQVAKSDVQAILDEWAKAGLVG